MYEQLIEINKRPEPFQFYTAEELWADEYTSKKMLEYHLNESIDVSSRNINFINQSVDWISNRFNLNSNSDIIDFGCGPDELNHLNNFWSPDDYYCFINSFKYNDIKVTLDKYTIIEKKRTRIVYNWLQYFSIESLKKEFEENNLIIDDIYSDVSGRDYNPKSLEFAVVSGRKEKGSIIKKSIS